MIPVHQIVILAMWQSGRPGLWSLPSVCESPARHVTGTVTVGPPPCQLHKRYQPNGRYSLETRYSYSFVHPHAGSNVQSVQDSCTSMPFPQTLYCLHFDRYNIEEMNASYQAATCPYNIPLGSEWFWSRATAVRHRSKR